MAKSRVGLWHLRGWQRNGFGRGTWRCRHQSQGASDHTISKRFEQGHREEHCLDLIFEGLSFDRSDGVCQVLTSGSDGTLCQRPA
jgi:hypothetical protein